MILSCESCDSDCSVRKISNFNLTEAASTQAIFTYTHTPFAQTYLERFSIGAAHLPTVFVLDGPNEVYWQPAHLAGAAVGPIQVFENGGVLCIDAWAFNR